MLVAGLTGGIASGKSTVAKMFARQGAKLIDLDLISREVIAPGTPGWSEVVRFFGPAFLNQDQTVNRKGLGEVVFSDPAKRRRLEEILHPRILAARSLKTRKLVQEDPRCIVMIEFPLLIEIKMHQEMDKVVLVYVSPQIQIERLTKRDSLSPEEAGKRLASQMPIDEKVAYADYIIGNEGDLASTEKTVREVYAALRNAEEKNYLDLPPGDQRKVPEVHK